MTFLSREAQLRMHFAATAAAATVAAATVATTMRAAAMRGAVAVLRAPTIARARADNDGSVVAAAAAVAERAVIRSRRPGMPDIPGGSRSVADGGGPYENAPGDGDWK